MLRGELLRVPGRVAGSRKGPDRDVVDPDVVGVAVAAVLVVRRDDVRLVAAHQPHQPAGGLVEIGPPERPGIEVPGAAHHVRVAVAEVLPLGDAEVAHGPLELHGAQLAEAAMVVRRVELGDDDLAQLAACPGDEHDPATRGDGLRHRAAAADRLVVGVGMDRHEGGDVRRAGFGRHGADATAGTGRRSPGRRRYDRP